MRFPIAFPTLSSARRYLAAAGALSRRDTARSPIAYDAGFPVYRRTGEYVLDAELSALRRGHEAESAARVAGCL